MGIRYLGSKARLLDALAPLIGEPAPADGRFVDAFAGTGVVAATAADLGWEVLVNDHLRCARLMSGARMLAKPDTRFIKLGGYSRTIQRLNAAPERRGFIWREYSPASAEHAPRPRRYFTEQNAARLDGMRLQIRQWHADGVINEQEHELLLADLLEAASAVANTAGTFGCFLSRWSNTARRAIRLSPRELRPNPVRFTSSEGDVFALHTEAHDTVYLDPPYTKRQYAAYYHLLETLAHGDEPEVIGVTGLRPWRAKASVFSYKRHAMPALLRLVKGISARRVLISYSNDGHIDLREFVRSLRVAGPVTVHRLCDVPRYQPRGTPASSVREFLIEYRPVPL